MATSTAPRISLEQIPLFKGLALAERELLKKHLHLRHLPARTPLMAQNAKGEGVYFLLSGTVRIYREPQGSPQVMLNIVGPGDVIGEIGVLDGGGHTAHAMTIEPSVTYWIGTNEFLQCVEAMPMLSKNLIRLLAHRLRRCSAHIESLSIRSVHSRVARLLWELSQRYRDRDAPPPPEVIGGTGEIVSGTKSIAATTLYPSVSVGVPIGVPTTILIPFRLTQTDIAAMVGASRLHVNKSLASLRRLRVISIRTDYRIVVLDEAALRRHCD